MARTLQCDRESLHFLMDIQPNNSNQSQIASTWMPLPLMLLLVPMALAGFHAGLGTSQGGFECGGGPSGSSRECLCFSLGGVR